MKRDRLYLATAWLPLAALFWTEWYVSEYEGWGSWAAGPMFLLPLFLSAAYVLAGVLYAWLEYRAGGVRHSTWIATLVSALPLIWLLFVARHVR